MRSAHAIIVVLSSTVGFVAACTKGTPARADAAAQPAKYLMVWAGPQSMAGMPSKPGGPDFIAVLDADTASTSYGALIASAPVGSGGMMAHHTEYRFPTGGIVFADDYDAGRAYLLDVRNPRTPKALREVDSVPGFRKPHSFVRLANGHVLATIQYGNGTLPGNPGGVAEFDADGHLVRSASSADSSMPGAHIRTYGLEIFPAIDRVLTTSSPMDTEHVANVVQLWRLSDLRLLKTIALPVTRDSTERAPFEIRALPDGRSAMMNSYLCGLYHVSALDTDVPRIEQVEALRSPPETGCSVPVIVGHYWILPVAYGHRVISYDISNPARPMQVSELKTDSTFLPHWTSADPGSDRIVLVSQDDGEARVAIIRLNPSTGALSWDERFHDADRTKHGVSFARESWPHGTVTHAVPHGSLFVPGR